MVFFKRRLSLMDKNGVVNFKPFVILFDIKSTFVYQAKRKQALLESNLPGINLIADENVRQWVAGMVTH